MPHAHETRVACEMRTAPDAWRSPRPPACCRQSGL